jgi:hypothetical protein
MNKKIGAGPQIQQIATEMGLEIQFLDRHGKSFAISCPGYSKDIAEGKIKEFQRRVGEVFEEQGRSGLLRLATRIFGFKGGRT